MKTKIINSKRLGKAVVPDQSDTNPDGSSIQINDGFLGQLRRSNKPMVEPFENLNPGIQLNNIFEI